MLVIPSIVGALAAVAGFIAIAIGRRQERRRQNDSK
jgi:hypothetical protein